MGEFVKYFEDDDPRGFKPVIHKSCGHQHSWVLSTVQPGDRCRSEDVRLLDGTRPKPVTQIPKCPHCGLYPTVFGLKI